MPTNSVSHTDFVAYPIPGLARIPRDSLVPNVINKTMCLDFTTHCKRRIPIFSTNICPKESSFMTLNYLHTRRNNIFKLWFVAYVDTNFIVRNPF
jgi:hypothetical protein